MGKFQIDIKQNNAKYINLPNSCICNSCKCKMFLKWVRLNLGLVCNI